MKLEKRSGGKPIEPPEESSSKGKKPVVVYIMILFIVAFLLMALSFASHQRSNTEALGQLQSSVSAMQEVQELQNQVISLQKELAEAKQTAEAFQIALDGATDTSSHVEHTLEQTREAMDWFWQLNEAYVLNDFVKCQEILDVMNENKETPLKEYLSPGSPAAARYQKIEEDIAALSEEENGSSNIKQ